MGFVETIRDFIASGYYGGAHGRMMSRKYDSSLRMIKKAISYCPDGESNYLYLSKMGEIYMRMGREAEAIPVLEKAMDLITQEVGNPPAEIHTDIFFSAGQHLQICRKRVTDNAV